ncbi:MAG: DUF1592 domain-containing protein [Bacteroidota bacterium]
MKDTHQKLTLKIVLGLTAILLLMAALPIAGDLHWLLGTVGRLHPLLVHLPIGALLILALFEALVLFKPEINLGSACQILLWVTALTIIPTVGVGLLLGAEGGYSSRLDLHQWLGWATALLSVWLVVLRLRAVEGDVKWSWLYHGPLVAAVVLVSLTGHQGGTITHGKDFLTAHVPEEIKERFGGGDSEQLAKLISQHAVLDMEELPTIYETSITPILSESCYSCHGDEEQKGGLQLNNMDPDIIKGPDAEKWRATLNMINLGEMPPKEEEPLTDENRRQLVEWLTSSLKYAIELRKAESQEIIRRLTQDQYTNSLNELLNVQVAFGNVLPKDAKSEMGFSNNGEVLQISPLHVDYYQQIARDALIKAIGPEEKPAPLHYRITIGKGIGVNDKGGEIGGYQSAPLDSDDFLIEILDRKGQAMVATDSASEAYLDSLKLNIGLGMRGSTQDRYEMVDEGLLLYSALPHKEVTPKSWQGPSPNLKFLMRKCFPEVGDFELRVKASRGYQFSTDTKEGLISLRRPEPIDNVNDVTLFRPDNIQEQRNLIQKGELLVPKDLTEWSEAVFALNAPEDGFYQIDFDHPYAGQDAMPSVHLRIDRFRLDERLHLKPDSTNLLTTPLTMAYLKKGQHTLRIGGRFFVGFSEVRVSYLPKDHELAVQLAQEAEASRVKYQHDAPTMRAFAGTRTDDGMDYLPFDSTKVVKSEVGDFEQFTFSGRLENLPIPTLDLTDTEILSNIMIVGVWNDYLVKNSRHSGPPLLVRELEFEGPYFEEWPPKSYYSIFPESEHQDDKEEYTREVISSFMAKAYRRPVGELEVDRYVSFWSEIQRDFDRYEDGVREVLVAILCSPNFLYVNAPVEDDDEEYALASKLSYFLWNAPPDGELKELARRGRLDRRLDEQVDRMIDDQRIWDLVRRFTSEWLRIDRHETMAVNAEEYKDFSRFVKEDMELETYHFFHHVLKEDLSILNFIESDFAMLNQNLAEFYGVDSVSGNHFRPVALAPDSKRGGLLSQGAFHSGHSDGTQAHPIKRAVWLQSKILGNPPPEPPPNVPELDPETPGFQNLTLKEQLEVHRNSPACMDCHKKIDPYGIVFENYDAVGRYQEMAKGRPIDAKVILPDMTEVEGIDGIKAYILEKRSKDFTRSLVKHLMAYAVGRDVSFADEDVINDIVEEVADEDYRFRTLIKEIVKSDPFVGAKTKKTYEAKILAFE